MRVLLGIILGAILTITGAYAYDVLTGRATHASEITANTAVDERPMVNWDVVGKRWHSLETNIREMAQRVHEQWNKRAG